MQRFLYFPLRAIHCMSRKVDEIIIVPRLAKSIKEELPEHTSDHQRKVMLTCLQSVFENQPAWMSLSVNDRANKAAHLAISHFPLEK